jgi:hypothetical protein
MMNKKPQPPLASIERKFTVFSDTDSDPDNNIELENTKNQDNTSTKNIPNVIKTLIKRRCETLKHDFTSSPHAGQIVLINAQTLSQHISQQDSKPSSDFHVNDPLFVLLDSAENNGSQWKGWLVTQETDYAGHWDICLDPERDAPLNPLVGMVQIWNRVTLHTDFMGRVVGELKDERLADIDTIAQRYQQYCQQHPNQHAEFTNDDPRHRYQVLYQQAADYLSDATEVLAIAKASNSKKEASLSLNQWLQPLFLQVDAIKRSIVPKVNYAMGGDEEKDNDLLLNKSLRIQASKKSLKDGKGYLIKMSIRLENNAQNYSIEFFEDDNLEHYFELSASEPITHFLRNPKNEECELVIRDENDNVVHIFHF